MEGVGGDFHGNPSKQVDISFALHVLSWVFATEAGVYGMLTAVLGGCMYSMLVTAP